MAGCFASHRDLRHLSHPTLCLSVDRRVPNFARPRLDAALHVGLCASPTVKLGEFDKMFLTLSSMLHLVPPGRKYLISYLSVGRQGDCAFFADL